MRSLRKSSQDRRPAWRKRVRWYEGPEDIRLQFETSSGKHNEIFPLAAREHAQASYDAFRATWQQEPTQP